ncbi:hypothetical protein AB0K18_09765 [Nonomuraea sp. NPDC049421]|uniref:hypothetical protein n=1 Tax=Nonomuraea sp. NPDC049421 TaxID=3155275 RepID=UPI003424AF8E
MIPDGGGPPPHHFRNVSGAPARMLCMCTPAGQDEYFMRIGDVVAGKDAPRLSCHRTTSPNAAAARRNWPRPAAANSCDHCDDRFHGAIRSPRSTAQKQLADRPFSFRTIKQYLAVGP